MLKTKSVLTLAGLGVLAPLVAVAFPDGPEPGHTGGEGQADCGACHYAGPAKTEQSGIQLKGLAETLVPGNTYQIELIVNDPEQQVGGFQLAIRHRTNSQTAGSAGTLHSGEGLQVIRDQGIDYLSHGSPQQATSKNEAAETHWRFNWTAPQAEGAYELAVAVVAANGDNSSLGDNVYQLTRPLAVRKPGS